MYLAINSERNNVVDYRNKVLKNDFQKIERVYIVILFFATNKKKFLI